MTGPRTAGQSRIVMAARFQRRRCSERMNRTNETRKGGKQSGGDGAVPSQAEIRCECAFSYMNAVSRKNLTDARAQ